MEITLISKGFFMFENLKFRLEVKKQKLMIWFVWKLPKWLIYYSSLRLLAHATTGKYGKTTESELKAVDALLRWDYTMGIEVPRRKK